MQTTPKNKTKEQKAIKHFKSTPSLFFSPEENAAIPQKKQENYLNMIKFLKNLNFLKKKIENYEKNFEKNSKIKKFLKFLKTSKFSSNFEKKQFFEKNMKFLII